MTEEQEPMTREDALEIIAEGKSIITINYAREVCRALNVPPIDESKTMVWKSAKDARERFGIFPNQEGPGGGVSVLDISYHVLKQLDFPQPYPGASYTGQGFQARANAKAIAAHFGIK